MLYIDKLNELTKKKRFSFAIAEKIIRGDATEEEAKRVDYLYDNLNDILHEMDTWISGDFKAFLDFIIEEKITPKEFELMNL